MAQVNNFQAASVGHTVAPSMYELTGKKRTSAISWFVMRYKKLTTCAKDNLMEIIDGDFKGVHGYLNTTQGKYGGMVIMPVSQDSRPSGNGLCFTIEVPAEQIGVISFANGKRHASDARIADARRRGRPDGSDIKAKYLKQKTDVDDAFSARKLKQLAG